MKRSLALAPLCALLFLTACSQSPEKLLATANKYHDNHRYKEASILYQKVISKDKTNAEAYYRQGLNLLDLREPGQAAGFLRRAVDLKPDNSDAATKLAEIYITVYASNPDKFKHLLSDARDLDSKVLSRDPSSYQGLRVAGLIAVADKDTNKALDYFKRANAIKPHSRDLISWYAETLSVAQHPDDAVALVNDMLAHDKTWGPGYDFLYLQYSRRNENAKAEQVLRDRVANDPTTPAGYINLSNYLAATGRFPEAEKVMMAVTNDKKAFPNGRELVGDFYVRNKKYDQALAQYEKGKSENPKQALGYQERIVAVYSLTGRRDDALKLAKETADKNPKDATANEVYASLLLQNHTGADLKSSLPELKSLVQKNPTDAVLHLDLARAYLALNNPDQALAESLEASRQNGKLIGAHLITGRIYEGRGDHGKAIDQTELVLASEPNNPEAHMIHAQALIATGRGDHGQAELEDLLKKYPQLNDARLQLASLFMQRRAFDRAKEQFDAVAKNDPSDLRGFVGLQRVTASQGHTEEAIRALQAMVDKYPHNGGLRYELANFEGTASGMMARTNNQLAQKYAQDAINNFKELIKSAPKSEDLWLRLGAMQRQTGQYDAALTSFEEASKVNPQSGPAYLSRALLLEAMGKKKEASDLYNRVLGLDSQNALALNNLAFLDAESGTNLDQAMTLATRAQKQVPNSPDVSDTLGYVYMQKNLNAEALQIFRKVVQDQPQNPTFRLHLAMALLKQGDKQGARDEAAKAMKTAPPQQQDQIRSFVGQIG